MGAVPRAMPRAFLGRPVGARVVRLLTSSATEGGVADEVTRRAWTTASSRRRLRSGGNKAEGVGGVGVEAPGLDGEGDGTAGEGEDMAGFAPVLESGADEFRGIEDGARGAAGDERSVVEVGAVEEAFGEEGNAAVTAPCFHGPTGKADGGDAGETAGEDFDEGFGGVGVFLGVVVEGAMEFDVGERDGRRRGCGEGGQAGDLDFDQVGEFRRGEMHGAAPEVPGLARVRAEVEAMGRGKGDDASHGVVVTGVTTTGDVHALDQGAKGGGEGRGLVLAEVAVEV